MRAILLLLPLGGCTLLVDALDREASSDVVALSPFAMVAGDTDNDGDNDIVIISQSDAISFSGQPKLVISHLRNRGPGDLPAEVEVQDGLFGGGDFQRERALLSPLDGDQSLDLLVQLTATQLQIFSNDGDGRFTPGQSLVIGQDEQLPPATGDLNGDSLEDLLVVAPGAPGRVSVLFNQAGLFGSAVTLFSGAVGAAAQGDFNGDGSLDIAIVNNSARIEMLLNDGQGRFTLLHIFLPGFEGATSSHLFAEDLNGDQSIDLVTVHQDTFVVLLNDGGGLSFSFLNTTLSGAVSSQFFVADLNQDQAPDLLSDLGFGGTILFRNDGAAGFNVPTGLGRSGSLALAVDLEGAGALEIVCLLSVSSILEPNLAVFSGDDGFSFPTQHLLTTGVILEQP